MFQLSWNLSIHLNVSHLSEVNRRIVLVLGSCLQDGTCPNSWSRCLPVWGGNQGNLSSFFGGIDWFDYGDFGLEYHDLIIRQTYLETWSSRGIEIFMTDDFVKIKTDNRPLLLIWWYSSVYIMRSVSLVDSPSISLGDQARATGGADGVWTTGKVQCLHQGFTPSMTHTG